MNLAQKAQSIAPEVGDYKILILAGGLGTRLLSRVSFAPKSLAPVQNRVFLDYLLYSLYQQGIRHIDFSLYYKADQIIEWLNNFKKPRDLEIRFAIEKTPLGTAGAIAFCRDHFSYNEDVFVCNGDTYLETGILPLLNIDSKLNLIATVPVNDSSQFGSVEAGSDFVITRFTEKTASPKPGTINAGLYLLRKDLIKNLKLKSSSIEREVFNDLISQKQLQAVPIEGLFIDIGTPSNYDEFINLVQNQRVKEPWI